MKDQTEKTKSKKKRQPKGVDEELMSKLGESFHTETTLMAQQRESCAKIAESFIQPDSFDTITRIVNTVAREIAAKIRDSK